jgi:hypothetical protein
MLGSGVGRGLTEGPGVADGFGVGVAEGVLTAVGRTVGDAAGAIVAVTPGRGLALGGVPEMGLRLTSSMMRGESGASATPASPA